MELSRGDRRFTPGVSLALTRGLSSVPHPELYHRSVNFTGGPAQLRRGNPQIPASSAGLTDATTSGGHQLHLPEGQVTKMVLPLLCLR